MKKMLSWLIITGLLLASPVMAAANLKTGNYIDIKGHWAENTIETVSKLGLMKGIGTDLQGHRLFAPEAVVSHAQLAVVLQQTFQLDYGKIRFIKQPVASDYFGPIENQAWYSDALVMCAINHVFDSSADFVPEASVSRIELARAIDRSFHAKDINIPTILMMPVFKDTLGLTQEDSNAMVFVNNTGIMTGNQEYFRPSDPVKRAELASVLKRCQELIKINKTDNPITIDENYNDKELKLQAGQSFTLSLPSNPTTGYSWSLSDNWDKKLLSAAGENYVSESQTPRMGQGGQQIFKFQALQAGQTELNLVYTRPWESVQPAQKFHVKLLITDENTEQTVQ